MNVLTPLLLLSRLTSVKLIIVHHTPPDKCDFNATVLPSQKYHFTNDNWPDTYDMGVNCRWTFNCVEGYACRLQCRDVGLPATLGCYMDRLLVSTTSDKTLGARVFCGREPINIRSSGTMITMSKVQFDSHTLQDSGRIYVIHTQLITSRFSPGGRFRCTITTEKWRQPMKYATVVPLPMKLHRIKYNIEKGTKSRINWRMV